MSINNCPYFSMNKKFITIVSVIILGPFTISNAFQDQAYLAYLRGLLALQSGNLAAAKEEYNRVLEIDKNAVPVYRDLAYVYWQSGDREKALDSALKLKEQYGDNLNTQLFLGSFYMMLGRSNNAREAWENALKIDANNETAILYLAAYHSANNNPKESIIYWDKYIQQKPDSAESYYHRGMAFEKLGQLEKATQSLEKTISLKPESYEAYFALAQLYEKQERLYDAIRECEKYLSFVPDNVMILLYLGGLYYKTKNFASAEEIFKKADKINPNDSSVIFWLGLLAEEKKDWPQAIEYFETLRENDETPMLLARLSYYYSLNNQFPKAIEYLKRAIELEPKNPNFYYLIGLAYDDMKNYGLAEQNFKEALKVKPDFTEVFFNLGVISDKQGKFEDAAAYFEKSVEIDPKFARALNYLGYSYAEKGIKLERAEELIRKALEIEPENASYLDSLGWVYFKQNKFDQAEKYLEQASNLMSDPVIWAHLGDTKIKLDKKAQAWEAYTNSIEIQPKNYEVKNKLKEIKKDLNESDLQRAMLHRIVHTYENIKSFKCSFFIKAEADSFNFEFSGTAIYLKPELVRIDVSAGIFSPQMTIIYNKDLKISPRALDQDIPAEVKEVFINHQLSLEEFNSQNIELSKKGRYFYYKAGNKILKIDKKTSLPKGLTIQNGVSITISDYVYKDNIHIPFNVNFFLKGKFRGRMLLSDFEPNKTLDSSLFRIENNTLK
ncbi:MAG: tetratricopeptide repeat protein [Elusimicrobia bacterium]|nr:tetratricopeptide repeat protein [Elusimicrobiota bacterium]